MENLLTSRCYVTPPFENHIAMGLDLHTHIHTHTHTHKHIRTHTHTHTLTHTHTHTHTHTLSHTFMYCSCSCLMVLSLWDCTIRCCWNSFCCCLKSPCSFSSDSLPRATSLSHWERTDSTCFLYSSPRRCLHWESGRGEYEESRADVLITNSRAMSSA